MFKTKNADEKKSGEKKKREFPKSYKNIGEVKKEYTIIAEPTGRKIDDAEKPADMNKWNLHEGMIRFVIKNKLFITILFVIKKNYRC